MNFIKSLKIDGYRGIQNETTINFALPNGRPGGGLTIIVGPNGSGKSSIIEALGWCAFTKPGGQINSKKNILKNEITLEATDGASASMQCHDGETVSASGNLNYQDNEFVYLSTEAIRLNMSGDFDGNYKPYYEYPDIARLSATAPVLKGKHIRSLLTNKEASAKLTGIICEYFPEFAGFSLETKWGTHFLKYTKNNKEYEATDMGTGFAAISYLFSHLVLLESQPEAILVFEEPELYLHPQTQKKLYKLMKEIARHAQVIIATHSPYFVNWADLDAGASIVRANRTATGICQIRQLKPHSSGQYYSLLKSSQSDWQKPYLFDVASKELLFAEKILFLEGQEDVGLLRKFASEINVEMNFDIFGYGAGGSGNMPALLQLSNDIGIKAAALFDSNAKAEIALCRERFKHYKIEVLPTADIRDKAQKGIQGIFDVSGRIKPEWVKHITDLISSYNRYFEGTLTEKT